MDTLLVIGAEGTVGANVACTLSEAFQVVGLTRAGELELDGCRTIACDFNAAELAQWTEELAPQWVVFSGAAARSSWDDASVSGEWLAVEAQLAEAAARATQRIGAKLTYISTDGIFAGPQLFHAEESTSLVNSPLADAALAAEQAVTAAGGLVVRTHAFGWSPTEQGVDFAECCVRSLQAGVPIMADAQRHATPILASDLAERLHAAYRAGLQGVIHLAGAERTNPRRFAHELAATLGMPRRPSDAAGETWQRTRETSLISLRAQQALQQPVPMLREGLQRFVAQLDDGYRDRLRDEEAAVGMAKAA